MRLFAPDLTAWDTPTHRPERARRLPSPGPALTRAGRTGRILLWSAPRTRLAEPGAGSKTIVFGLFQRAERVYTGIVPDCSEPTLQGIIWGKSTPPPCSKPTAGTTTTAGQRGLRLPLPRAPLPGRIRAGRGPHQRHRVVLELRQGPAAPVRGRAQTHVSAAFERMRIPLKSSLQKPV